MTDDGRPEPEQAQDDKPPYRVPLLAELAEVPRNGLTIMSTFSGCGGSCLGFEWAGYTPRLAVEFVDSAVESYKANHPGVPVWSDDIRELTAPRALSIMGLKKGELDVLEGSPPCESFSTAGIRSKGWGKTRSYCVAPNTKVLRADMTWTSAAWLEPGEELVAFDEEPREGRKRAFRTATVISAARIEQPCVRITMEDGTETVCSEDHRWLWKTGTNLRWRRAIDLEPGDRIPTVGQPWLFDEDASKDAGWLAGFFDGEGCVSNRDVSVAQRRGPLLDRARSLLLDRGFSVTESVGGGTHGDVVSLRIGGPIGDRMRFLGIIHPIRLVAQAKKLYEGLAISKSTRKSRVSSVERIGPQEVIAVKTSEGTFIANGLLSHNSDGKNQVMDDLFFEFTRLLGGVKPRAFVAENVSGLVKGAAKGYFMKIHAELAKQGYRVEARMLDAQWLGVPQRRQRVIFVGVRNDLKADPVFPDPLPYRYSIRDALGQQIDAVMGGWPRRRMSAADPAATIGKGGYTAGSIDDHEVIERIVYNGGRGGAAQTGRDEEDLDAPIRTITTAHASDTHFRVEAAAAPRKFEIAELIRLCGFPDDFVLKGTYSQQWERLGNSVPPPMMMHVAAALRDRVLQPT